MAQVDEATLVVGTAKFYTAPVGTAAPTDLGAPDVAWTEIGHTSLENVLGFDSEGGEVTILGTLQKKQLRSKRSPRIDRFRLDLQQWDEAGLKLYYGSNATVGPDGMLQVPVEPTPTSTAFLMVAFDGPNEFGIYAPKSEIMRADNPEIGDTESLATLPLEITPLQHETNNWAYAVTPLAAA